MPLCLRASLPSGSLRRLALCQLDFRPACPVGGLSSINLGIWREPWDSAKLSPLFLGIQQELGISRKKLHALLGVFSDTYVKKSLSKSQPESSLDPKEISKWSRWEEPKSQRPVQSTALDSSLTFGADRRAWIPQLEAVSSKRCRPAATTRQFFLKSGAESGYTSVTTALVANTPAGFGF